MFCGLVKYSDLNAVLFVKFFRGVGARSRRCRRPFPLLLIWNCLMKEITFILGFIQEVVIIHNSSYISFVGLAIMPVDQT